MPFHRNEETGWMEYIPHYRTPQERRRKIAFNEAFKEFFLSCHFITVYQFIKMLFSAYVAVYWNVLRSPLLSIVNLFSMAVVFGYLALVIIINHEFRMESKLKNRVPLMFGFIYAGVCTLALQ